MEKEERLQRELREKMKTLCGRLWRDMKMSLP